MRHMVMCLLVLGFALFNSTPATAAKPAKDETFTSADKAGPDFAIQGEYEGVLAARAVLGAQVVALGGGKFDVYFLTGGLPGGGWNGKDRVKATGKRDGLKLKCEGGDWSATIEDGKMKGKTPVGTDFTLRRVIRKSRSLGMKPPAGAVVLFDGTSADEWAGGKLVEKNLLRRGTQSKKKFGAGVLHIEFRTPFQPRARGQGRGNSGVYVQNAEVQVLDSFGLEGKADECGAFYGRAKPRINLCLPPLSWQTYDIAIKEDAKGNTVATVLHNGVRVHNNFVVHKGPPKPAPIFLQDHGNPVAYRNIWFLPDAGSGKPAAAGGKLVLVTGGDGKLMMPFGVDFDRAGNLYLVEFTGQRVRKLDTKGRLSTIAGTGTKGDGGDGGPAAKAEFNGMHSLAVTPDGDVYLADTWNNRVRKIDHRTGVITTIAGTGEKGFAGDGGPATKAKFSGIHCIAFGPKGDRLYLADTDNRRIRMVDLRSGTVTTVAGNGEKGVPKDRSEAVKAPLVDPRAVAVDAAGRVYVLERTGHALRVVGPGGKIRTVAGTGKRGNGGDGGDALRASFNGPKHLCIDRDGNVVIADTENHVIRKYLPGEKKVVRVAGTGRRGKAGVGGPPLDAELNQPHGVHVRADGTLYIADSSNNRVLKVQP